MKWQLIKTAPKDGTQFLAYFPYTDGMPDFDVVSFSIRHNMWASHDAGWGSKRYDLIWLGAKWTPIVAPAEEG